MKVMKRIAITGILLTALVFNLAAQTPEDRYAEAGKLYTSGDFSGAAAIYRKLYDDGYRSSDLLYNTGNAFFKAGDNARAIIFYERARLAAPADEDINYNLQIARSRVTDKFETLPQIFLVRWFDFISLLTSTNTWAVISMALFIIALMSFLLFLTRARARGRLLSFWLAVAALVFSVLILFLSIRNNTLVNHNSNAVITCSIVTGRSAPGDTGSELFVIHSGTKVTVEEELGDYCDVLLPDGNKGWVRSDCMEKI
jgi:tetratricopeptide (TPR) repeat protein